MDLPPPLVPIVGARWGDEIHVHVVSIERVEAPVKCSSWYSQSPHAGVAQPARRTHQMMGSGIGRPVIHSSREFPATDRRAGAATPFDRSSGD